MFSNRAAKTDTREDVVAGDVRGFGGSASFPLSRERVDDGPDRGADVGSLAVTAAALTRGSGNDADPRGGGSAPDLRRDAMKNFFTA